MPGRFPGPSIADYACAHATRQTALEHALAREIDERVDRLCGLAAEAIKTVEEMAG